MQLRARPTASTLLRLALLTGVTLFAPAAHAAPWDSWFSSDSDSEAALGPRRVPERNAGDRTSAEALNFSGQQPHAAGAGGIDMPQSQVQGLIDQPGMGPGAIAQGGNGLEQSGMGQTPMNQSSLTPSGIGADHSGLQNMGQATDMGAASANAQGMEPGIAAPFASQAPSTPLFAEPGTNGANMASPPPASYRPAPETPGFGDRFLSWAGLGGNSVKGAPEGPVNDNTTSQPMVAQAEPVPYTAATVPAAPPEPAAQMAQTSSAAGVEYYDADGYPILSSTPQSPIRPDIATKAVEAKEMGAMNQAAEGTRTRFLQQGEAAFAPDPNAAPYQPAPLDAPLPAGPLASYGNGAEPGPMDELALGGNAPVAEPARAVSPPTPHQPVNAPDAERIGASPSALRASRLTDTAPLEMPPTMASAPPASIDLMPTDASTPQPGAMEMVAAPRMQEPTAPASRDQANEAASFVPHPTPEAENRIMPARAPVGLSTPSSAFSQPASTNVAPPIASSGAPIPLPPPIAFAASDTSNSSAPGEVRVTAPGTVGANRIAPLRYLPDSRYTERRTGAKPENSQ